MNKKLKEYIMRKIIVLVISVFMLLSLLSCNVTNHVSSDDTVSNTSETITKEPLPESTADSTEIPTEEPTPAPTPAPTPLSDATEILFDDVLLVDDDNVTIWIVSFYRKDVNWSSGRQNEKFITFKVKNKTKGDILVNDGKFYLKDDEVDVIMEDGSIVPDAGKSGCYAFMFSKKTSNGGSKALDSILDLVNINGYFDVNLLDDQHRIYKDYKLYIDVSDVIDLG